jgi:hypothetical protein
MLIRKPIFLLLIFFLSSFFISCNNNNDKQNNDEQDDKIQTVKVSFLNESPYYVKVHRDSFYGPIVTEVNTSDRNSFAYIRPSDNNGVGTVFSIEYIIYPKNDDIRNGNGEIFISCYDTDVQIKKIIKAGEPCTIQIPHPPNLVCKSAFIKIINLHYLPIEFCYVLNRITQADNNTIIINPYEQGLYKLDGIPDEGKHYQYYNIAATFESTYFSDFSAQNGLYITKNAYIYHYTFNGTSIINTKEEKIVY